MICIGESLDVLATELSRIAHRISVILPWGSLLRAVAAPDIASLRQIARLCLPGASIEIVLSYDRQRDQRQADRLGISQLDEEHITSVLPEIYQQAGLQVLHSEKISLPALLAYQTTWAKRLTGGRRRDVWRLSAQPTFEDSGM